MLSAFIWGNQSCLHVRSFKQQQEHGPQTIDVTFGLLGQKTSAVLRVTLRISVVGIVTRLFSLEAGLCCPVLASPTHFLSSYLKSYIQHYAPSPFFF